MVIWPVGLETDFLGYFLLLGTVKELYFVSDCALSDFILVMLFIKRKKN
jgi:hypothetical protein